jgi:hypothetical protein
VCGFKRRKAGTGLAVHIFMALMETEALWTYHEPAESSLHLYKTYDFFSGFKFLIDVFTIQTLSTFGVPD